MHGWYLHVNAIYSLNDWWSFQGQDLGEFHPPPTTWIFLYPSKRPLHRKHSMLCLRPCRVNELERSHVLILEKPRLILPYFHDTESWQWASRTIAFTNDLRLFCEPYYVTIRGFFIWCEISSNASLFYIHPSQRYCESSDILWLRHDMAPLPALPRLAFVEIWTASRRWRLAWTLRKNLGFFQ